MIKVITFGTFDLLHIGHINILERARALGDHLIVGVSTDELNHSKKNHYPVYKEQDRLKIISALRCVNQVFLEESLELKGQYIKTYKANILVMGADWEGRFDKFNTNCKVIYLPRTHHISTSQTIKKIKI